MHGILNGQYLIIMHFSPLAKIKTTEKVDKEDKTDANKENITETTNLNTRGKFYSENQIFLPYASMAWIII